MTLVLKHDLDCMPKMRSVCQRLQNLEPGQTDTRPKDIQTCVKPLPDPESSYDRSSQGQAISIRFSISKWAVDI